MLSSFRRFIHSKFGALFALLFLGVIAAAFIMGDISNGKFGSSVGGGDTVAKVGGSRLTLSQFQDRLQRVFENARRSNPGLQISDFLAQGAARQIYDQLVAAMTLKEYAEDQGVHISKRLVDAQIAQIPAFQDAAGNFSQDNFRQLLQRERITEQALRDDIARDILERQMLAPIGLGATLSDSLVLPYASLLLEARQGTIAAVPAIAFKDIKDPTDAQLNNFYRKNAARYAIPEQRRIRYAVIDGERFAQASQPAEAEIAAFYNQNKASYAAKERRTFEQLILPTQAAAKAVADAVKGGKSFAAAAEGAGLASSTLADQTRQTLASSSSSAVADAAFAAKQGALVGPLRGSLGWVLLRVTKVDVTPARSLDAVRGEIVASLRDQKQKRLLSDFTGKIEDQVADGGSFEEVVKDNGLKLETTPLLLATGRQVEDDAYKASPDVLPLLAPVFQMSQDDDAQLIPIRPDQRYALAAPAEIQAAAPAPLAKIKPLVVLQYKLAQGNERAKAVAEQIRAKVAKGMKLADAVSSAGLSLPPPQVVGGRRADIMRDGQRPPAEVAILFSMAANSVKTLPMGQDKGYFIVQLNAIKHGDAGGQKELLNQVRAQLGDVVGQEYGQQFEHALERQLGAKRSPTAIADVQRALAGRNGAE